MAKLGRVQVSAAVPVPPLHLPRILVDYPCADRACLCLVLRNCSLRGRLTGLSWERDAWLKKKLEMEQSFPRPQRQDTHYKREKKECLKPAVFPCFFTFSLKFGFRV